MKIITKKKSHDAQWWRSICLLLRPNTQRERERNKETSYIELATKIYILFLLFARLVFIIIVCESLQFVSWDSLSLLNTLSRSTEWIVIILCVLFFASFDYTKVSPSNNSEREKDRLFFFFRNKCSSLWNDAHRAQWQQSLDFLSVEFFLCLLLLLLLSAVTSRLLFRRSQAINNDSAERNIDFLRILIPSTSHTTHKVSLVRSGSFEKIYIQCVNYCMKRARVRRVLVRNAYTLESTMRRSVIFTFHVLWPSVCSVLYICFRLKRLMIRAKFPTFFLFVFAFDF